MSFYQPSLDAIKGPDPLTDNWTYDSAIDLFSWNPMMPDPFTFDLPDDLMNFESKDLSAGMVAPSDISGFVIGNHMGEDAASISVRYSLHIWKSSLTQANLYRTPRVMTTHGPPLPMQLSPSSLPSPRQNKSIKKPLDTQLPPMPPHLKNNPPRHQHDLLVADHRLTAPSATPPNEPPTTSLKNATEPT